VLEKGGVHQSYETGELLSLSTRRVPLAFHFFQPPKPHRWARDIPPFHAWLVSINEVYSSADNQRCQVSTVDSKGSSMGFLCFICSCVFKTKKKLFHHIEIALRCMYDDHLVLQQQGPIHESVPIQHIAQLTHLHYCRDVASEVAAEMGVYGQDDGMFADRPVTLDHDGQRKLERSTPPLDIPMAESRPLLTVANPAKHGSVYNPYTTSSPSNYDPPRIHVTRPKGFTARRPNHDLNGEHWSDGEDNVGGYFDDDDGDEMVRRSLG
jgi:hypothetical protein